MDRNSERFHFEITGDPCNLIGSQKFDLISSFHFFCIKPHILPSQRESFLMTKMQQSIRIQGLFKVTNQFVGE